MRFLSKIPNLTLALFMSILAACGTQQGADNTSAIQKKLGRLATRLPI